MGRRKSERQRSVTIYSRRGLQVGGGSGARVMGSVAWSMECVEQDLPPLNNKVVWQVVPASSDGSSRTWLAFLQG
jgi:hypothetical protein